MDSETPQTKEIDSKTDEGKAPENDQDTAIAGGTEGAQEGGGGHDNKSDSSDAAADMEGDAGDLVTAATAGAIVDDTKEPKGEKNGGEDSSPQAERDTDETKKDEDASESDAKKVQSEPETTEKVPLDMDGGETGEEKEKEEGLQYKVRFDVSGDSSTEAAGEETKVDPTTAAGTDAEKGLGTPTKQPLSSTESGRGKEPAWYSRTSLLITSVFSIFCFFPMGIVALYYGMKVKDAYHSKHEAAKIKDYARRSTFCSIAAITTGIITLILILVVTILGITGVVR